MCLGSERPAAKMQIVHLSHVHFEDLQTFESLQMEATCPLGCSVLSEMHSEMKSGVTRNHLKIMEL